MLSKAAVRTDTVRPHVRLYNNLFVHSVERTSNEGVVLHDKTLIEADLRNV
jgi:hypothetical protein